MMAENLTKRPAKGILKASTSFDHAENKNVPDIKWDEMNILQTLHPPDKDYGHMKIDEPKTPYSYYEEGKEISEHTADCLDANILAEKINMSCDQVPKVLANCGSDEDEEDEYANETEEERAIRKAFEQKRKMHYNEFYAVKLARKLIARDLGEEDDDDEEEKNENGETEISDKD